MSHPLGIRALYFQQKHHPARAAIESDMVRSLIILLSQIENMKLNCCFEMWFQNRTTGGEGYSLLTGVTIIAI